MTSYLGLDHVFYHTIKLYSFFDALHCIFYFYNHSLIRNVFKIGLTSCVQYSLRVEVGCSTCGFTPLEAPAAYLNSEVDTNIVAVFRQDLTDQKVCPDPPPPV